jgi:hypothetical protein
MTDYTIQYLLASQKQGSYEPGQHGIIQIATVPLDADFKAMEGVRSSYSHVKPDQPECQLEAARQEHIVPVEELMLNAPTQAKAKDWLVDWFKSLRLGHVTA